MKFKRNPNRTGTCYKLSGKRRKPYIARAYKGKNEYGESVYQTIGYFEIKTEGMTALLEYNINPYDLTKRNITLKELFNLWKEEKIKDVTFDTFNNNYERPFRRFLKPLHEAKFKDLRPVHYQQLLNEYENKYSKRYLDNVKKTLNNLYNYAILQDIIKVNYAKGLKVRGKKQKEQPFFTDIEIAKIIKLAPKVENADMILMLCLLGLRPQELFNITKFNVDFEKNMLTGIGIKTDAGRNKRVPISHVLIPYFKKRCAEAEEYLFINPKKNKKMDYNYFYENIYKPTIAKLGIEYKPPKSGRHGLSTLANQEGLNDKAITTMIGHTNIEFTKKTYMHTKDEFLSKEYEKIDHVFEGLTKNKQSKTQK